MVRNSLHRVGCLVALSVLVYGAVVFIGLRDCHILIVVVATWASVKAGLELGLDGWGCWFLV
ncbi:hypothetical protein TSUD_256850 [Trifolium subterraneum]|uniref:Uncharacterized protein n=1 Tax=Trifolium subterraneum TaxID=3900 RepID=A0A2Z6NFN3_TRISU|nr:hypothetical protein TSUD_256850 [Trifolium subterraneum]